MYEDRKTAVARLAHDLQAHQILNLKDPAQRARLIRSGWSEADLNSLGDAAKQLRDHRAQTEHQRRRNPNPRNVIPLRPRARITDAFA